MVQMKTLTVNGKTYEVADPDAAHIDDTAVGENAWSGRNTVDRLCPAFTENGAVVSCEPVEGYPLGVVTQIEPVQAGEGDPSPDNIRPITGHTTANLWRGGKNLFGGEVLADKFVEAAQATKDSEAGTVTYLARLVSNKKLFEVPKQNMRYTFIAYGRNINNLAVANLLWRYADGSGEAMKFESTNEPSYLVTTSNGDKQVIGIEGSYNDGTVTLYYDQCGVFEGVVDEADFEPYKVCETFTIDLGQTVYGGSLDWKTGLLTVTHGSIASYAGEEIPVGRISSIGELSQGAQVVYPLSKPITVQLTPTEILALSGTNTLYSDTGDTAVTGKADPVAKLERLENAILALGGSI